MAMNEREAIQRELTRERRTMRRQELLKRLRKLDVENRRNPVVEETVAAVKSTPVGLPSSNSGRSTNGLNRNGRPDAGSMASRA
jgi:hypothetical protein